ncbi:galactose oxidase-like domain-containing protein [Nitrosomonas sp. Nm166]|uniref:galactose oxidase-like domain-containing protein n=1 Tax=Nitrosomonas sp. Nm166 TaxID=1881054 RepID=UPI0008E94D8D|nr:galactose oxidase-like domain-containing protein [Nitrosomonas sp. Nm166]SFE19147.1 Glyoxal oxidase N-terminus [Nitrosomonas sp. Nm166]
MFKLFLSAPRTWCLKYFISVLVLFLSIHAVSNLALAAASEAHLKGKFGPLHDWPIIPLSMMLMPDGRVFAYGTDTDGNQGAKLHYVIWNPPAGTGAEAFKVLPNTTNTDTFCAGQALIPNTGHALIVGGDAVVNNKRNYANNDVNIFDPTTDTLIRQTKSMAFKRWYATAVTLPNGEHAVLGGRDDKFLEGVTEDTYSSTPEVRSINGSWRVLSSATSSIAYGELGGASWYYPRAWVNPQGNLFILAHNGAMFKLDTRGTGTLTKYATKTSSSRTILPSVMYAPGRILSIRRDRSAVIVNINGTGEPVLSSAGLLAKDHQHGSATVLADGQVWVNGGSSTGNTLDGRVLESELWNPKTNRWTVAASATTARLYHSTSLLLPDGTVFTGGGGAPGPLKQLNGEIYYPPYLFKTDESGQLAFRPEIIDAPTTVIGWNQSFSIESDESITRVTLVRVGAATHTFDHETRFFNLPISQTGKIVTVKSPRTAKVAPPGFYLLFVWNAEGVPSVAKIIQIG